MARIEKRNVVLKYPCPFCHKADQHVTCVRCGTSLPIRDPRPEGQPPMLTPGAWQLLRDEWNLGVEMEKAVEAAGDPPEEPSEGVEQEDLE